MKKNNVVILMIFLLAVMSLIYSFTSGKKTASAENVQYMDTSKFKLGSFITGYGSFSEQLGGDVYNWHYIMPAFRDSLGFNSCVFYPNTDAYTNGVCDGGLYQSTSGYEGYVNFFMGKMNNAGVLGSYDRGTIRSLCGSQRSTYEAEDNTSYGFYNNVSPVTGHTYTNDQYGVSGRCAKVIPAQGESEDNPGYLVSGLIENAEQSDTWSAIGVGGADDSLWYVKPRMRIDSIDAVNNLNTPIARVDIVGFWGNVIKSIDIKGKQFLDSITGNYDGKYLEEFNYLPVDSKLTISGNTDTNHLNHAATTDFDSCFNFKSCKVDYRIYWYGVCNLWVDYVRLEDQWAYHLLNLKDNDLLGDYYRTKVKQEASAFKDSAYYFHYDEIRKNNIPSLRFVQHLIDSVTNNKTKIVPVGLPAINNELKHKYANANYFLDSINPPYLFTDCYPFGCTTEGNNDFQTWLPPNITVNKTNLNFLKKDYNTYTNRLQYNRLGDKSSNWDPTVSLRNYSLVSFLNRMTTDAKSRGKEHIITLQAHSWLFENTSGDIAGMCLREPTNEEIVVETNLALCYGVKGIYYFALAGDNPPTHVNSAGGYTENLKYLNTEDIFYSIGIMNYIPSINRDFAIPVTSNYYGQNKYINLKELNRKTNALGVLLKKLNWQDAFSVHHDGANHYYINDIESLHRDNMMQFSNYVPCIKCDENRFWEMGFFEKSGSITGEDYSKYFMMVNRRTTPEIDQDGDIRMLKIKFNTDSLLTFKNWKMIDIYTNDTIFFSSDNNGFINLGYLGMFKPGEGKLFKLAPVM